jgi:hypothetical protein
MELSAYFCGLASTLTLRPAKGALGKGVSFVKSRLKRLPGSDESWEADFEALPMDARNPQARPGGVVRAASRCGRPRTTRGIIGRARLFSFDWVSAGGDAVLDAKSVSPL